MLELCYLSRWLNMLDKTTRFTIDEIEDALISRMLDEVFDALEEKGYEPLNQIVGYLMSGDPGFISSHRDARSKIAEHDRSKILITILKGYMER